MSDALPHAEHVEDCPVCHHDHTKHHSIDHRRCLSCGTVYVAKESK